MRRAFNGLIRLLDAWVLRTQLRTNIISSLGTAVASIALIGIAYPLYLHFLGYEQYGLWLVLSTVLVMAQLGNLGISPALLKLVAEDFAAADIDGVYKYIGSGIFTLFVTGAILAGAVLLLRHPIIGLFGIKDHSAELAYRLLPYIGALSVYVLMADALNSALAGLGRYDLVSYCQLIGQALTVVRGVDAFGTTLRRLGVAHCKRRRRTVLEYRKPGIDPPDNGLGTMVALPLGPPHNRPRPFAPHS